MSEKNVETVAKAGTETLNIVNDMLRGIMTEAGKLKDFAVEQLPDVVQQFLQWKFYEHLTYFAIAMFIFVIWIILDIVMFKLAMKESIKISDNTVIWLGWGIFGCAARSVPLISILHFINIKWLQIMIAPKVYLLEYAANLVK